MLGSPCDGLASHPEESRNIPSRSMVRTPPATWLVCRLFFFSLRYRTHLLAIKCSAVYVMQSQNTCREEKISRASGENWDDRLPGNWFSRVLSFPRNTFWKETAVVYELFITFHSQVRISRCKDHGHPSHLFLGNNIYYSFVPFTIIEHVKVHLATKFNVYLFEFTLSFSFL